MICGGGRDQIESPEDILSTKRGWRLFENLVKILADVWKWVREREQLDFVD